MKKQHTTKRIPNERGNTPPPRNENSPTFTVEELAERWRCTRKTVTDAIAEKKLAAFRVGKRTWRINAAEVARFEKASAA